MAWRKIALVMRREYLFNFRRPSFLFTAFGVPLLSLVALFLIFQFTAERETNLSGFQRVGYVDRAGVIDTAAPNPDGYRAVTAPGLQAPPSGAGDAARAAFDALEEAARQQLVDGDLDAYIVVAEDYVLSGRIELYTRKNVPAQLTENIESFMRGQIAFRAPADLPVPVARLEANTYTIRDRDSGEELSETALIGRFMLPFIFVMIYFMATSTTAQFLMSGVVEEKENRLMEIFATSLRPQELLWGKLLGLGALALTQVVVWSVAGVLIARGNADAREFVSGAEFQAADLALVAGLFVINFALFSAIMLGIGASVTAEAESRQVAGLFTFITVLPIALMAVFFSNPDGPLPLFFTFFPLTAATALIMRLGLTTLPAWQIALSVAIQVISVLAVMWLAVRVFRLGMLMYGKPLTPRTLWTALREGRTTLTTATVDGVPAPRRRKGLLGR